MDSTIAINDFKTENNILSDAFGNLYFDAIINYKSSKNSTSVHTQVKIQRNGFNDGDIEIIEKDDLTSHKYHLFLTKRFQKYSVKNGELFIKGSSQKMGGNYIITISVI